MQRFVAAASGPVWLSGWSGGTGPRLLFIPPLFGEMNRCRRLMADCAMLLAAQGFSCWIVDLPGTGESEADPTLLSLDDWHDAVDKAATDINAEAIIALRGGAILGRAHPDLPRWILAAIDGPTSIRELLRLRMASDQANGRSATFTQLQEAGCATGLEIGGYWLSPALFKSLLKYNITHHTNVINYQLDNLLKGNEGPVLTGAPLWRYAEPGRSIDMAGAMADAIARYCN